MEIYFKDPRRPRKFRSMTIMSISAANAVREDDYTSFNLVLCGDIGYNYFVITIKYKTKDILNDMTNLSNFNYEADLLDITYHDVTKNNGMDRKPSTRFENIIKNNLDYLISLATIDRIEI